MKGVKVSSPGQSLQHISAGGDKVVSLGLLSGGMSSSCCVLDGNLKFMVTSERDLHRARRGRMKTQWARTLVTWGFPNRGFLLLNFSLGALPRY